MPVSGSTTKRVVAQPRVSYCKNAVINDGVIMLLPMLTRTITLRTISPMRSITESSKRYVTNGVRKMRDQ